MRFKGTSKNQTEQCDQFERLPQHWEWGDVNKAVLRAYPVDPQEPGLTGETFYHA